MLSWGESLLEISLISLMIVVLLKFPVYFEVVMANYICLENSMSFPNPNFGISIFRV